MRVLCHISMVKCLSKSHLIWSLHTFPLPLSNSLHCVFLFLWTCPNVLVSIVATFQQQPAFSSLRNPSNVWQVCGKKNSNGLKKEIQAEPKKLRVLTKQINQTTKQKRTGPQNKETTKERKPQLTFLNKYDGKGIFWFKRLVCYKENLWSAKGRENSI